MLGPVLEKLADKHKGQWELVKIDTEAHQDIAMQFGIRGIPNVKLFIDGKVAAEFSGAQPEQMVEAFLKKNIPGKTSKEFELAEALIKGGQREAGIGKLEQVIAIDPQNHKARVLLAKEIFLEDSERALALISTAEETPELSESIDAMKTLAELVRKGTDHAPLPDGPEKVRYAEALKSLREYKWDTALENFIEVIRNDRYYDEDGARKACIAIFKFLGEDNPTTQAHRRPFSSALY